MTLLAHRGHTAIARDNSRHAIGDVVSAVKAGVALGIEVDVRLSADGLVMNHDAIESGLYLRETTTDVLEQCLTAGDLLLFEDALAMLCDIDVVNIEIKQPEAVGPAVAALTEVCSRDDSWSRYVLSSFVPWTVSEIRRLEPRLATGLLVDGSYAFETLTPGDVIERISSTDFKGSHTGWIIEMLEVVGADYLHVHWSLLSRDLIDGVSAVGKSTSTWTVNDVSLINVLVEDEGIAHVVTDFPHQVFATLNTGGSHRKWLPG